MLTAGQAIRDRMLIASGDAAMATEAIRRNVEQFGAAPGAKKMLTWEKEAADLALETGVYTTWRSSAGQQDCTRVGPSARCFCGHSFKAHTGAGTLSLGACGGGKSGPCKCKRFEFIPRRPEELGEWWLPRRKGFNINTWRPKCRCKHSHDEHAPPGAPYHRCAAPGCGCGHFSSDFLCVVCDKHWEDHETVTETEAERRAGGRPVRSAFYPLADTPDIQALVFGAEALSLANGPSPFEHASEGDQLAALAATPARPSAAVRRAMAPPNPVGAPERSVRLSAVNAGGRAHVHVAGRSSAREQPGDSASPHSGSGNGGGGSEPKFCHECGQAVARASAKFCSECGTQL
eukprot:jgi/Tetstr1/435623/TSEL_024524.t1